MNILNLYAGIGGNRALWGDDHVISSIELDASIIEVYRDLYPKDHAVCNDAHQVLEDWYMWPDFIWSSPPCQTHSSFRQNIGVRYRGVKAVYPDMKLWQEILFLQANAKCKGVVENVKPYYKPLIEPSFKIGRHYFWSNFDVDTDVELENSNIRGAQIPDLQAEHGIDLTPYKIKNKRQILRNCVNKHIGLHILNEAMK